MKVYELKWVEDINHNIAEDCLLGLNDEIEVGIFPHLKASVKDDILTISGPEDEVNKAIDNIQDKYIKYGQIIVKEIRNENVKVESFDENVQDIFNHTLDEFKQYKTENKYNITKLNEFVLKFMKFKKVAKGNDKNIIQDYLSEVQQILNYGNTNTITEKSNGFNNSPEDAYFVHYVETDNEDIYYYDGMKWVKNIRKAEMVQDHNDLTKSSDIAEFPDNTVVDGTRCISPDGIVYASDNGHPTWKWIKVGKIKNFVPNLKNKVDYINPNNGGEYWDGSTHVYEAPAENEASKIQKAIDLCEENGIKVIYNNELKKQLSNPKNWGIVEEN